MLLQISPLPNIRLTTDLTFLAYLKQSCEHLDNAAIPHKVLKKQAILF